MPRPHVVNIGDKFGTKVVTRKYAYDKNARYECICSDCGKITYPTYRSLVSQACPCTKKNLAGMIFNDIRVIERRDLVSEGIPDSNTTNIWKCECKLCGKKTLVSTYDILHGIRTKCRHRGLFDALENRVFDSYVTRHPLYKVYQTMLRNCYTAGSKYYYMYGAAGITVCDEWYTENISNDPTGFIAFIKWSFENGYITYKMDSGRNCCRLVRLDKDGPYSPENCEWQYLIAYQYLMEQNMKLEVE